MIAFLFLDDAAVNKSGNCFLGGRRSRQTVCFGIFTGIDIMTGRCQRFEQFLLISSAAVKKFEVIILLQIQDFISTDIDDFVGDRCCRTQSILPHFGSQ